MECMVHPNVPPFNEVVWFGFTMFWFQHITHSIHKYGDVFELNNYRTIVIAHTITSLYETTIHTQLSIWLERGIYGYKSSWF